MRFTAKQFPSGGAPPYIAVSYTWGTGAPTKHIYLNGSKVLVRENLYWCLYYIHLNPHWKHIWVDFISIDQQSVQERNEQVHSMHTIYGGASLVIAWLGLEPGQEFRSHVPSTELDYDSSDLREHASHLAQRPFWSRRWVVQEMLLAVDVSILCGAYCISWNLFKQWLICDELTSFETLGALPFLLNKDSESIYFPNHSLEELLLVYRHTNCQDPRDRVFALLGLLAAEEREAIGAAFPDYSLSHTEVVAKTVQHLGGIRLRRGSVLTDHSREVLEALGFKHMRRAAELLGPSP